MGRDGSLNETVSGPLPSRFEVDLTSVCVRMGAIQLPFRLRNTFENGAVTALDAVGGNQLDLEFRSPRQLVGFQPYFAAHDLRPNDRIALVFEPGGLRIEAIRRGRGASGDPAGAVGAQGRGMGAAEGGRDDASSEGPGASKPPAKRAVVRERIRGNAPPLMTRPDFGAGFATVPGVPLDGSGAADGSARQGAGTPSPLPRWEPLDVMAPPDGWPDVVEGDLREVARAQGHVVVREVRRSRPSQAAAPAAPAATGASAPEAEATARGAGPTPQPGDRVTARSTTAQRAAVQAAALERVVAQRSAPQPAPPERPARERSAREPATHEAVVPTASAQHTAPQRTMAPHPVTSRAGTARSGAPRPSGPRPMAQRAPTHHAAADDDVRYASELPPSAEVAPEQPGRQPAAGADREAGVAAPSDRLAALRVGVLPGKGPWLTDPTPATPPAEAQPTHGNATPRGGRARGQAGRVEAPADVGGAPDASGHGGRGLELFGIRLRLRRGRSDDASGPRAQARSFAPLAAAAEPATPPAAKARDDFTDAFLEFGDTAGDTDELTAGRLRPWLPTGEYRPTDASPRPAPARRAASPSAPASAVPARTEPAGRSVASASAQPARTEPAGRSAPASAQPAQTEPAMRPAPASAVPAQPPRADARAPMATSSLRPEDDFAVVTAYLARPDVPAIVRTEHVAMSLGVSTDRVERVMLRIAEDRERVTRIRSGAYMVRRRPEADAGPEA